MQEEKEIAANTARLARLEELTRKLDVMDEKISRMENDLKELKKK